jgi:hypothetical protein
MGASSGTMKSLLLGIVLAGTLASPALAQSTETWNGLPDRFRIDTGYFHIDADTVLRFNGPRNSGGDVAFEDDLAVPSTADTFWLDGTWRVGRRHQLELGYTRLSRDQPSHTLTRQFQWGGLTYNAGLTANTTTGTDLLGGYYRFAAFRNDRFEIGPTVGVGYLWISAGIRATGQGTGNRTLDVSATKGSITGAVGGYTSAWPLKRLVMRADFLYIKVSPGNADASVTDWRIGSDYYITRHVGAGVQYKYNKYKYDREAFSTSLGGDVTFKGFQVFASFLF